MRQQGTGPSAWVEARGMRSAAVEVFRLPSAVGAEAGSGVWGEQQAGALVMVEVGREP